MELFFLQENKNKFKNELAIYKQTCIYNKYTYYNARKLFLKRANYFTDTQAGGADLVVSRNTFNKNYTLLNNIFNYLFMENAVNPIHLEKLKSCNYISKYLTNGIPIWKNVSEKTFFLRLLYYTPIAPKRMLLETPKNYLPLNEYTLPLEYFPLYYSIIACVSKSNQQWKNIKLAVNTRIKECINDYVSPEYETLYIKYYNYWLDIIFPDELYNLLQTLQRIQTHDINLAHASYTDLLQITPNLAYKKFLTPSCANYYFRKFHQELNSSIECSTLGYVDFPHINFSNYLEQEILKFETENIIIPK